MWLCFNQKEWFLFLQLLLIYANTKFGLSKVMLLSCKGNGVSIVFTWWKSPRNHPRGTAGEKCSVPIWEHLCDAFWTLWLGASILIHTITWFLFSSRATSPASSACGGHSKYSKVSIVTASACCQSYLLFYILPNWVSVWDSLCQEN